MEDVKKSKEEAYILADAFRIAFEQQLGQRQEQVLRLAEALGVKKETRFAKWRRRQGAGSRAGGVPGAGWSQTWAGGSAAARGVGAAAEQSWQRAGLRAASNCSVFWAFYFFKLVL